MQFFRNNGLTIVLVVVFALSLGGMALTGHAAFNAEQTEHGRCDQSGRVPFEQQVRLGYLRELGKRIPADGILRHSDSLFVPAGFS